jgi:hypothetical protein
MDKVADFYERWYATKRIPDYCGVESASEELAKQPSTSQTCGVQFLRGTILHLACQAHLYGAERMTVRDVIEFLEAQPIENRWEELIASQAGNEQIRWLASRAGEFMANSPPPVGRAILETVVSRLWKLAPDLTAGSGRRRAGLSSPAAALRILKGDVNP